MGCQRQRQVEVVEGGQEGGKEGEGGQDIRHVCPSAAQACLAPLSPAPSLSTRKGEGEGGFEGGGGRKGGRKGKRD